MKAWRVFSIGTTDVCIHPALPLYLLYAILTGHGAFAFLAVLSITLHEGAHAGVSALFGEKPASLELTPLGAVMRLEDDNRLPPLKRFLTLIAGPLMTFALCLAAIQMGKTSIGLQATAWPLFMCNLSILLLNLLPVLPLDGGRMLALILTELLPVRVVYRILRSLGLVIGAGLIGLNIYASWRFGGWNLSMAFAGCCILYASSMATLTQTQAELHQFMDRKISLERRECCPMTCFSVLHHIPVRKVVRSLPSGRPCCFLCIEAGSMAPLGWLTESELIQHYLQSPNATVSEALLEHNHVK